MIKFLKLIKNQKNVVLSSIAVAILSITLAFGIGLVFAWTEPESEPPYGNVGAPINTGSDYQKKTGDLGVNFLYGDDIRLGNWTQNPISAGGNIVLHNGAGTETIDINGGSGELTVSDKITSSGQLCIGANCITSWDEVGGDGGGLTCATCDAQGDLNLGGNKLIIQENDGEIFREGGNIIFQADDQWQWYSSWSMQNEMTLHYENGLWVKGKITAAGGIDPPYISFSDESHQSIREFAKSVEEHEKVMQFWNGETHRLEVYVINEDKFYTITGELIE